MIIIKQYYVSGSSNNKISGNTIANSISQAILINNGSSGNTFSDNKVVSSTPQGLKIVQDSTAKNNIFSNNQIIHSTNNLSLFEFLDDYFPNHKDENGDLRPQVLIFDQLEELFSFYPGRWIEQQKEFFQQVADSLQNNPLLRVVFIIREDHLAHLDSFKSILPEKLRPKFRLERLREHEAALAIKGPLTNIISTYSEEERKHIESEIKELVSQNIQIISGFRRKYAF